MNEQELNEFFDSISLTAESDLLEKILKVKNHIGEMAGNATNLNAQLDDLQTQLIAQTELCKKYEKMVRDYVKSVPVSAPSEAMVISDYDDFT